MRKLISFKIGGGLIPVYSFEWQSDTEGLPEIYRLKCSEAPDPALIEAAHEVGKLAAKMVSINATNSDMDKGAAFHGISFDYPKSFEGYRVKIKAEMTFPWNGYTFKYETPAWRVEYGAQQGEFQYIIKNSILGLLEECWKYVDGDRAQVKLLEESAAAES